MKKCSVCNVSKQLDLFYKGSALCKACRLHTNKEKRRNNQIITELVSQLEGEQWSPISGLEKFYRVSSFGRITSLCKSAYGAPWPRKKEKVLKPQLNSSTGYYCYVFSRWGSGKDVRYNIHKLVATHFIPNQNNLPEINHKNGIKTDNNVSNLEWVTREENIRHGFLTGLIKVNKGENAHNSVLTNEQVLYIYNYNGSPRQLSRDLGMPYSRIASIRNGVSWNHITGATKKYYGKEKNKTRYSQ